jgi:hypothetical protein
MVICVSSFICVRRTFSVPQLVSSGGLWYDVMEKFVLMGAGRFEEKGYAAGQQRIGRQCDL